jgi:hypothetical protein
MHVARRFSSLAPRSHFKILASHPSDDLGLNTFLIPDIARSNDLKDSLKALKFVRMMAVVFCDGDGDDEGVRAGSDHARSRDRV